MSDLQTEEHRTAWRVVVDVMPGSEFISHEIDLDGEAMCAVHMPMPVLQLPLGCPRCGDPKDEAGLDVPGVVEKVLCRDWHDTCQCGARWDEPKNKGCRRRRHPKKEEK